MHVKNKVTNNRLKVTLGWAYTKRNNQKFELPQKKEDINYNGRDKKKLPCNGPPPTPPNHELLQLVFYM
jgi:hypothetical protein